MFFLGPYVLPIVHPFVSDYPESQLPDVLLYPRTNYTLKRLIFCKARKSGITVGIMHEGFYKSSINETIAKGFLPLPSTPLLVVFLVSADVPKD